MEQDLETSMTVRASISFFTFGIRPPVRVRDLQRLLIIYKSEEVRIEGRTWTAEELADLGRHLGSRAVLIAEDRPMSGTPEAAHGGDEAPGEPADASAGATEDEAETPQGDGSENLDEDESGSVGDDPEPSDSAAQHAAEHRLRRGWAADGRLLRQVCRLLVRWVEDDGVEDFGPRIDWTDGTARLLTHRDPLRARREERGIPRLAVLLDDSPSCGRFVGHGAPLVAALMRLGVAETVAVHANGYDADVWASRRFVGTVPKLTAATPRLRSATHVLVLGDWDAAKLYQELAIRRQIIWLDGFRCATVGCHDATDLVRARWGARSAANIRYIAGCRDVEDWVTALAMAVAI